MLIEIASVQSLVSSQRVRDVFCASHCPLGHFHSQAPVQPWMSPWAEAVGLFSLWKRSWSGTSHTFCCPEVKGTLEPAMQDEHRERARGHRHWLQQGNCHLN